MRLKGIELPVNSVIIIALAVMVLLMLAVFFMGGTTSLGSANLGTEWTQSCGILKSTYNCNADSLLSIRTEDVTGDGVEDSLLDVCKLYFNKPEATKYFCRNKCCNTQVSEGMICIEDDDCRTGLLSGGWICSTGRCCPTTNHYWDAATNSCVEYGEETQ